MGIRAGESAGFTQDTAQAHGEDTPWARPYKCVSRVAWLPDVHSRPELCVHRAPGPTL